MRADVERVIRRLQPALQADGGELELVDVTGDGVVRIRLAGACRSCSGTTAALLRGIERAIQTDVPDVARVELVS